MQLAAGKPETPSATHLGATSIASANVTDVIVVEQRTGIEAAAWGGVLAHAAKQRRIRGVVVDGPVRDIDEIGEVGLAGVFTFDYDENGTQPGL